MRISKTYDVNLEMKDTGLVASSAAATVDGSDKIIDLGSSTAFVAGDIVIDVSSLEIESNDESYTIVLQGSSESDFSSDYVALSTIELGANEVLLSDIDSGNGRFVLPFTNELNATTYRYLRLYTVVEGTVTSGINYTAYLAK